MALFLLYKPRNTHLEQESAETVPREQSDY
jgi:hypothetical protein